MKNSWMMVKMTSYQGIRSAETLARLVLDSMVDRPLTDDQALELGDIYSRIAAAEIIRDGLGHLAAAVAGTRFQREHAVPETDPDQGVLF